MQTIEINTSQNVKIEYQLAAMSQRIFAYIIDIIIMLISLVIIILGFQALQLSQMNLFIEVFVFIWIAFYTLVSEIIGNGQTLGKLAMGIKVIKLNGDELEFYDYFSRWSMRLIDIYASIGTVAMLLISSNKSGQRIGDILAGTTIIRKKNIHNFALSEIMKLNLKSRDNYEFEFPLSKNLDEKDVILIKNLLYRKRQFNNRAHEEALNQLVDKLVKFLELKSHPNNREAFLGKVISEYIIHTR